MYLEEKWENVISNEDKSEHVCRLRREAHSEEEDLVDVRDSRALGQGRRG